MALVKQKQELVMGIIAAATVFGWQAVPAAGKTQEYQQVPLRINTTLVVDDKLMVGDGYSIDSVAINDGCSNTYSLQTEVGEVNAISDYQLARKIQALQTLDAMSRAGVFGGSMKGGVMAPFHGAKALVTSPIQTTKGAVKGIGRWTGNIGRAVASDDPYQEGGVSAAVGWAGTKRAFALELEGSVSPQGRKALASGGWTVKERVALLTGDALQDQTTSGAGMGATTTSIGVIAP